MNHTAAIQATPVADAPLSCHGETDANPRPDPRATSTMDEAAATNAPPKMAGQVTAETEDSGVAVTPARYWVNVSTVAPSIVGMSWVSPKIAVAMETVGCLNSSSGSGIATDAVMASGASLASASPTWASRFEIDS
jgi:hypothetical protein